MRRILLPAGAVSADAAVLRGEQRHYAADVLRVRPGDRVCLFDGAGRQWEAVVERVDAEEVRLELLSELEVRQRPWRLELALSLVRGPRFEWAVEKCAELGVSRVVPLLAERCTARSPGQARLARWRRVAAEAARQCGRADVTEVSEAVSLSAIANDFGRCYDAVVLGSPEAGRFVQDALRDEARNVLVLVGPEGGFTEEEESFLRSRGAEPALLGRHLLRSETAAVVACALCAAELERRALAQDGKA